MQPDETTPESDSAPPEAKAPSPLRSAGALHKTPWPHAPLHQLSQNGTYFVTAGTYLKAASFSGQGAVRVSSSRLAHRSARFGWQLGGVGGVLQPLPFRRPLAARGCGRTCPRCWGSCTRRLAKWVNKLDPAPGRQVWFNFRETRLTYEKSYLARLNYTHRNAVKHRLVPVANQYPWCSAAWFERAATPAQVKTIYGFKTDRAQNYMTSMTRLRSGDLALWSAAASAARHRFGFD